MALLLIRLYEQETGLDNELPERSRRQKRGVRAYGVWFAAPCVCLRLVTAWLPALARRADSARRSYCCSAVRSQSR